MVEMRFLAPSYFLFLLLIPILIILYMLRTRRKAIIVPSLYLWRRYLKEEVQHSILRKIIRDIILLLQILAVILITLGLTQPNLLISRNTKYVAFIIDTSASMQAEDIKPSRFAYAKEKAIKVLNNLERGTRVSLFTSDTMVRLILDYTEDRGLIKNAIRSITPKDVNGDIRDTLLYIEHLERKPDSIFIFSDGAFSEDIPQDLPINLYCFSESNDNAGIINISARGVGIEDEKEILVAVQNFSSSDRSIPFQLWDGDRIITSKVLNMKKGKTERLVIGPRRWKGTIRANIYPNDIFPLDDRAYITFPKLKPSVLLVTSGNPYLEASISLADVGMVDKVERFDIEMVRKYDIVIFDGTSPAKVPPGNYLFIGKMPENLPLQIVETKVNPTILTINSLHPIMRFVNIDGLEVKRAVVFDSLEGENLVSTSSGALAWSYDGELGKIIVIGFYPEESSFIEKSSFPIFIKNVITWLGENPSPNILATGEALKLRTREANELVSIVGPSEVVKRTSDNKRILAFNETSKVGIYSFKSKIGNIDIAVNLCSPLESDISKKSSEREFNGNISSKEMGQSLINLWYIFALGALGVLFAEGYLFYGGR